MKILVLLTLLLFSPQTPQDQIKTFRNHNRFSVKYDKFKDETTILVGPFFIGGTKAYFISGSKLYLYAAFSYPGQQRPASVKDFYLLFESRSRDWKFLRTRDIYAVADGERFTLGEASRDADVGRRSVSEDLAFTVPAEVFAKFGKAEKLEVKLGTLELRLKDEHIEAFRDLYSLSRP